MIKLAENIMINESTIEVMSFDRWKLTIRLPHATAIVEADVDYPDYKKKAICHEKGDKYYDNVVWSRLAANEKEFACEMFSKWTESIAAGESIDITVCKEFEDDELPHTVCFRAYVTH